MGVSVSFIPNSFTLPNCAADVDKAEARVTRLSAGGMWRIEMRGNGWYYGHAYADTKEEADAIAAVLIDLWHI